MPGFGLRPVAMTLGKLNEFNEYNPLTILNITR